MKKLIYIFALYYSLFLTHHLLCQWLQISDGMGTNQIVNAFSISGNNILAGTYTGIYLSTNNGNSWTQTNLNNKAVLSIAVSGNSFFAGTNISGVYLSTNNGTTWTQTALDTHFVFSLAVSGNTVFAGTNAYGVYLSTNNGTSWMQTSLNNREVRCFTVNGNYVFAGTTGSGVYLSSNNGTTWVQTALNSKRIFSLAVNGNNIYAGVFDQYNVSDRGVFLSTNNGTNWMLIGINTISIRSFALSGNNLFAGTEDNGVYITKNNGINWYNRNQGFANIPSVSSLLIKDNYVFAGTLGYSVWHRQLMEILDAQVISLKVPSEFSLFQNYPNPFNPVTRIEFDIPRHLPQAGSSTGKGFVSLKVYDVLGREVQTLVNEEKQAGSYAVDFNGSDLTSGVYFYSLETQRYKDTKRMVLIK